MPPYPCGMMKRPAMSHYYHHKRFEHGPRAELHHKKLDRTDFKKEMNRGGHRSIPAKVDLQTEK